MLVVRYGLAKAGGALLRSMGSQPIKVALTPDGTIFAVTQFGAVDLFHLKGGAPPQTHGCWWQCAKGPQWRTTRTTLPVVDVSGNITRLAG